MSLWKAFALAAAVAIGCAGARAADEAAAPEIAVEEESQWERFKEGARIAGEAVAQGAKNTAEKVADSAERAGTAIVDGSKKAGHSIAETYEEAKGYVEKKME